jgi:hypothetical protein
MTAVQIERGQAFVVTTEKEKFETRFSSPRRRRGD